MCYAARTTEGRSATIRTSGYINPQWHEAYRKVVTAEMTQAFGRARSGNPDGIPAVVIASERLELPIWENDLLHMTAVRRGVYEMVREYQPITGVDIASRISRDDRNTRRTLAELATAGLINKINGKGWSTREQTELERFLRGKSDGDG